MGVGNDEAPLVTVRVEVCPDDERTPALLEWDGQVDVVMFIEGKSREDGIAVTSLAKIHVGLEGPVLEAELLGQNIDLPLVAGPGDAVVHLLEEGNVRVIVRDGLDDALEPVFPVYAADTFVDVVGEDPDLQSTGEV